MILLFIWTPISPLISDLPAVGTHLAVILAFMVSLSAMILFFDAGRILYTELSEASNKLAIVLAGEVEKLEK